jgi:hypothetical protein
MFVRKWESRVLTEYGHIEELITLVYTPGEELHDFPPREIILAQKTSCENSHYLDGM